jgi:hypothetical protein
MEVIMINITPLKEKILNCMTQWEEELWRLSEQANQNRNLSQMDKTNSIMREQKKISDAIKDLFDEIGKVQKEPETNSADRTIKIICPREGEKPTAIRIGEEEIRIDSWNQILIVIANWILEDKKNLPEIKNFISPNKEGFAKSAQCKPLKNGWFIEVGDSAKTLINKAKKLLRNTGYTEEILVETKDETITSAVSDRVFDNRTKVIKLYRNASPEKRNKIKELLGLN